MAFTWRTSQQTTTGANIPNFTITEPVGITAGDWEFVIVSTPSTGSVTTPSGWTQFGSASGTNALFYIFYVTGGRGASAPTLVFTCTDGAAINYEWHSLAVGGSNLTIDTSATTTLGARTNPDCPASTANFTNDEAIAIGFNWTGSGGSGWGAPGSYTIRSVNTAGLDGVVASRDLAVSGSEDPAAYTGGAGSNDTWEATILLEATSGIRGSSNLFMLGVG